MDFHSRKQYLMGLREDYLKATKKEKTRILNEYTKNTRHNRKYVITMLNADDVWTNDGARNLRPKRYGPEINAPLVKLWGIFDFPCGQRLKPCITEELERIDILRGLRLGKFDVLVGR